VPNYEELYYSAKNKYYRALEDKNNIRRKTSELQGKKSTLTQKINQKSSELTALKHKVQLVQEAEEKCASVKDNEFQTMKRDVQYLSNEYKKIINSDKGVADIQSVYSSDIQNTQSDLENILLDLRNKRKDLENKVNTAQQELNNYNSELSSVNREMSSVGSEYYAQQQANCYYSQMKEYERKWKNGC